MDNSIENLEIDDSLYSRQRYVLGDTAMKKMAQSTVFLHGLGGVGIEIAKNLILAGIKELTIQDDTVCTVSDLGTQFFIREADIELKKTRVQASLPLLAELNPYVHVSSMEGDINGGGAPYLGFLENYQCIILTECRIKTMGLFDDFCRSRDIQFIVCDVMGVLGTLFCDFGDHFEVQDATGEEPKEIFVGKISKANPGVVTVFDGKFHDLETNDMVTFKEVNGMTELNGIKTEIKVISPSQFSICDTSLLSDYTDGGIAQEVKQGKTMHFQSFVDQCYRPTILTPDLGKLDSYLHLHLAFLTIKKFLATKDRLPYPQSEEDFASLLQMIPDLQNGLGITELDTDLLSDLCFSAAGSLPPLCAFFGGVAAQEALKAITGKFTPLQQWLYLDCREVIPTFLPKSGFELKNDRYDPIRICLGNEILQELRGLRIFMVGCGAIGCELLKNLALLGVSSGGGGDDERNNSGSVISNIRSHGDAESSTESYNESDAAGLLDSASSMTITAPPPSFRSTVETNEDMPLNAQADAQSTNHRPPRLGRLVITDHDLIEKSNLNRQFLFRSCHIRRPKSTTAAESVLQMNPDMRIDAHQHKVCTATEKTIYTDTFFSDMDICLNALDNVEARRYMDVRCVTNRRPLLESGTMGTKGHVQVIVPHITETYGSQTDPPEKQVPFCTLKSFPALMEHCIEWGRDKFESQFTQKPELFRKFWTVANLDPVPVLDAITCGHPPQDVCQMTRFLRYKPSNWTECVQLGRVKFEKHFNHKAHHLLRVFPLDTTLEDGSPFWQSPKRPPTPLEFDPADDCHMLFLRSSAQLFATICGVPYTQTDLEPSNLLNHLDGFDVPPYVPTGKKIVTDEKEAKSSTDAVPDDYDRAANTIRAAVARSEWLKVVSQCQPHEFEKDDDSNGHIDFITAASNLRARMYNIAQVDRFKVKKIAGRIVPAIATTTAAVAGLVIIELIKIRVTSHLEKLRNTFLNLALPSILLSEPGPCRHMPICKGSTYTVWDRWEIRGRADFTLNNFVEALAEKYDDLVANMVVQGTRMIYVRYFPNHEKRLAQKMLDLVKVSPEDAYVDLMVSYYMPNINLKPEEDDDANGPPVRYYLHAD